MASPFSRDRLLKRLALAAALGLPAGLAAWLPGETAAARPSPASDRRILNFLLLLEYVQEGFYARASQSGALTGELSRFATVALRQERAHVAALRRALAGQARQRPTLHFGTAATDPARFGRAALQLEETAAAAYIGQGANLTEQAIREIAGIVSVEARHAAWIRDLLGKLPAPLAADKARSADQALAALKETGFVRS